MKPKLTKETGREDDVIFRGVAVNTVSEYEGVYPVSLWHVPKAATLIRCKDCRHFEEHHYEKEGEDPYIKYKCGSKYGLDKSHTISPDDFCSRAERDENDSFINRT